MTQEEREAITVMFFTPEGVPLKMAESKPRLSLVPRFVMEELARVYEYGAEKYQVGSWKHFTWEQAQACLPDAAMRHLVAYCDGETHDPESRLNHLAQCAWNCLTLAYHERTQQ